MVIYPNGLLTTFTQLRLRWCVVGDCAARRTYVTGDAPEPRGVPVNWNPYLDQPHLMHLTDRRV